MVSVIQRVTGAEVQVDQRTVSRIGPGLLALVAVVGDDSKKDLEWTANKMTGLRIFRDEDRHFELDVRQIQGEILLVSNFTVAAQTRQGRRPSFSAAAEPALARSLFQQLVAEVRRIHPRVGCGEFGEDMKVTLCNDGPVTLILESKTSRNI
jgi:D-aminoacyl-tRNA deacylase